MRDTTLQTFGRDPVFTVKIVGVFKTETRKGRNRDLSTLIREHNGVNLKLHLQHQLGIQQKRDHLARKIYIKHD